MPSIIAVADPLLEVEAAAVGETFAVWDTSATAWDAPWAVLLPTTVPLGTAATAYSNGTFSLSEPGGTMAVPVNLDTTAGSATLVYGLALVYGATG